MIFRFRMLSDENDNFVRDYEVPYDMTLLDFHRFLLESLEYEECMTSFFTADERWEKLGEFTLMDMGEDSPGAPRPMESVTLGQIIHNLRDRLIYLFDMFGDRAYFLELTGAYEARPGESCDRGAVKGASFTYLRMRNRSDENRCFCSMTAAHMPRSFWRHQASCSGV